MPAPLRFSTPRRLALTVEGLTGESPAVREERKGPRVDAPDKAVEGFLRVDRADDGPARGARRPARARSGSR